MKKSLRPYGAIASGKILGYKKTHNEALEIARTYRTNFCKSSEEENPYVPIKIIYDQIGEPQRTVHEE